MAKIKILITDGIDQDALALLKSESEFDVDFHKSVTPEKLLEIIGAADCIIIRSATTLTKPLIDQATNMKLIVRAGAGVDNIDVKTATEKKIPVMNTASANSLAAAEQTIALLFAMFRKIPQAAQSLKNSKWDRDSFKGFEVTGKTIGVIGLGSIGKIVCEKCMGLGMSVVGFDPVLKTSPFPQNKNFKFLNSLDELWPVSDVVSVHVPKIPATSQMISTAQIKAMKKGSFIINCARGGIVDEKAVIEALNQGHLEGAAFDVFEKEPPTFPNHLVDHPKVITVPHLGASTFEAQVRVGATASRQIIDFFKHGKKNGVINL